MTDLNPTALEAAATTIPLELLSAPAKHEIAERIVSAYLANLPQTPTDHTDLIAKASTALAIRKGAPITPGSLIELVGDLAAALEASRPLTPSAPVRVTKYTDAEMLYMLCLALEEGLEGIQHAEDVNVVLIGMIAEHWGQADYSETGEDAEKAVDAAFAELAECIPEHYRSAALTPSHWECNCVPDLGPTHCHACSDREGRPVTWADGHPVAINPSAALSHDAIEAWVSETIGEHAAFDFADRFPRDANPLEGQALELLIEGFLEERRALKLGLAEDLTNAIIAAYPALAALTPETGDVREALVHSDWDGLAESTIWGWLNRHFPNLSLEYTQVRELVTSLPHPISADMDHGLSVAADVVASYGENPDGLEGQYFGSVRTLVEAIVGEATGPYADELIAKYERHTVTSKGAPEADDGNR